MKKIILLSLFACMAVVSFSQKNGGTYNWAAGLKYQPAALSLKHYNLKGDAIEFLLTKYNEGTRLTTLLELCPKILNSGSLRAIVGPGFHVGVWDSDIVKNTYTKNPIIGFDAIVGIEYKIPRAPIAIQLDFQPSVDLVGNDQYFKDWGGITIKFCW